MEEVLHVSLADAVVDPRAVMVHLKDTEATLAAVMRTHRLPCLFANALLTVLILKELALEWRSQSFLNATWVRKGSPQVADISHSTEAIEGDEVEKTFHSQRDPRHEL